MKVSNSVKALVLSTRETSTLLLHPSCQKCFGERGILSEKAYLSLSSAPAPSLFLLTVPLWGFPGSSVVNGVPANAGDLGSIPGSGRSPAEGNSNPVQHSCLENSMDGGAW